MRDCVFTLSFSVFSLFFQLEKYDHWNWNIEIWNMRPNIHRVKCVQTQSYFWSVISCIRGCIQKNTDQKCLRLGNFFAQWLKHAAEDYKMRPNIVTFVGILGLILKLKKQLNLRVMIEERVEIFKSYEKS